MGLPKKPRSTPSFASSSWSSSDSESNTSMRRSVWCSWTAKAKKLLPPTASSSSSDLSGSLAADDALSMNGRKQQQQKQPEEDPLLTIEAFRGRWNQGDITKEVVDEKDRQPRCTDGFVY